MKEEENQAPEDNHSDAENEPKLTFNPKLGLVEGKFVIFCDWTMHVYVYFDTDNEPILTHNQIRT